MWLYCNIIGAAQNPAENKWQESSFPHAWYWNSQIACPRFRFKLWHMCSNERVHHVRLHSIVVLPVNKDTNHSNEHRVFGYSRLILQLQSSFHRLQFCTCAIFWMVRGQATWKPQYWKRSTLGLVGSGTKSISACGNRVWRLGKRTCLQGFSRANGVT